MFLITAVKLLKKNVLTNLASTYIKTNDFRTTTQHRYSEHYFYTCSFIQSTSGDSIIHLVFTPQHPDESFYKVSLITLFGDKRHCSATVRSALFDRISNSADTTFVLSRTVLLSLPIQFEHDSYYLKSVYVTKLFYSYNTYLLFQLLNTLQFILRKIEFKGGFRKVET